MRKKPVQRRSRLMVDSIIEATARIVAEEGLDALTTNRVAERAGISNGSLYQYFHDRNDLIEALLEKSAPIPRRCSARACARWSRRSWMCAR